MSERSETRGIGLGRWREIGLFLLLGVWASREPKLMLPFLALGAWLIIGSQKNSGLLARELNAS